MYIIIDNGSADSRISLFWKDAFQYIDMIMQY